MIQGGEAPRRQGTKKAHIGPYVTDERRRLRGWLAGLNVQIISAQAIIDSADGAGSVQENNDG